MWPLLTILVYSCLTSAEYIPGTPGNTWTTNELLIVKSKLWRLLADGKALQAYKHAFLSGGVPNGTERAGLGFFAAKLVRLSFHDCVPYKDGSGGCDGCLNWKNVTDRYTGENKWKFRHADLKEGGNTGLEYTVAVLEKIYTDIDFPLESPKLDVSLKYSGKSRADLWAYAAKIGIEFTIENNNYHCDGQPENWSGSYVGQSAKNECHRDMENPQCKVILPREIKFQYGRKDCAPDDSLSAPYITYKDEAHPNPEGNGTDTLEYFQTKFKFNGRETIAIFGAHTIGRLRESSSLYKYQWTSRGGHLFNNAYYRNLVNKPDWFIEASGNKKCTAIGYHGKPTNVNGKKEYTLSMPDTTMVPSYNGFTASGGPTHWIRFHFSCPDCSRMPNSKFLKGEYKRCCVGKPENLMCKPDNKNHWSRNTPWTAADDTRGCEKYRFAFGLDGMAINAEMGLYYKFEQQNGLLLGCSGLKSIEDLNKSFEYKRRHKGGAVRQGYKPNCEKNDMKDPPNDQPFYEIIENYADDQSAWVHDFVPAFEKMMRNGYEESDLFDAPPSWEGVNCVKGKRNEIQCSTN